MRKTVESSETCPKCGAIKSHEKAEWYCDYCTAKIDMKQIRKKKFEITIFPEDYPTTDVTIYDFCDWGCALRWIKCALPELPKFGFMTLPYLHFEDMKRTLELIYL